MAFVVHMTRAVFAIFLVILVVGAVFWYDGISTIEATCPAQLDIDIHAGVVAATATASEIVCFQNAQNQVAWARVMAMVGSIGTAALLVPIVWIETWW